MASLQHQTSSMEPEGEETPSKVSTAGTPVSGMSTLKDKQFEETEPDKEYHGGFTPLSEMDMPDTDSEAAFQSSPSSSTYSDSRHSTASSSSYSFGMPKIPRRLKSSIFGSKSSKKQQKTDDSTDPGRLSITSEATIASSVSSSLNSPSLARAVSLPLPYINSISSYATGRQTSGSAPPLSVSSVNEDEVEDDLSTEDRFKHTWDQKLRSTMEKLSHLSKTDPGAAAYEEKAADQDLFPLLLKLYAHQDIVSELYKSYEANAVEFEFYIPQLCTFFVHGNYAKQHQLECFLLSRCNDSLAFAHRLQWFLQSYCNGVKGYKSESLSVTSSQTSDVEDADLLTAIEERAGVPALLMSNGLCQEEVSIKYPNNLRRRRWSTFSIDKGLTSDILKSDQSFADHLMHTKEMLTYEAKPEEGNPLQMTLYQQTPAFVAELTRLAHELIPEPLAQRNTKLREGLDGINQTYLPSNVIYLPIGNSCHRVKAIHIDESFCFSTKERVPFFMCVEVLDYSPPQSSDPCISISKKRRKRRGRKFMRKKLRNPFKSNQEIMKRDAEADASQVTEPSTPAQEPPMTPVDTHKTEAPSEEHVEKLPATDISPSADAEAEDDSYTAAITSGINSVRESVVNGISAITPTQETSSETSEAVVEQKKNKMGQWGLPRVRKQGGKLAKSGVATASKQLGSLYSSLSTRLRGSETANTDTPLMTDVTVVLDNSPASMYPPLEEATPRNSNDFLKTPDEKPQVSTPDVKEKEDDDGKEQEEDRARGRDMSVSLDFTDAAAWNENFGLDEIESDQEHEIDAGRESVDTDYGETEKEEEVEEEEEEVIVFREQWSEKEARIRQSSPFGEHPGWRLMSVIVKSDDDLRQEQFAAQLIAQCDRIFKAYKLPLALRPYNVIATSATAGLVEAVPDTVSLDSLKRNDPEYTTLLDFFERLHGPRESRGFLRARRLFVQSLAAYSILCYVFQIKDRHNGNILVDTDGRLIHIDFGFFLTNSPGSNMNFERAPFKLTDEFIELMGGPRSSTFRYFRSLCIRAYLALRRNMDKITLMVEMMLVGNADLPCFAGGNKAVIEGLRSRLKPGERTSTCNKFVNQLIDRSMNNWRTRWYDKYQRVYLGIL